MEKSGYEGILSWLMVKRALSVRDIILSGDFKENARGELLLLRARVLFEINKWVKHNNKDSRRWLFESCDHTEPHSFEFCCYWLGLSPNLLRRGLKSIKRKGIKKRKEFLSKIKMYII